MENSFQDHHKSHLSLFNNSAHYGCRGFKFGFFQKLNEIQDPTDYDKNQKTVFLDLQRVR